MRRLALALLLIATAASPVRADAEGACSKAFSTKNWAVAARECRKAAGQGHASAQSLLGFMYAQGQGVPRDFREALKWFHKAAEQGDARARFSLGVVYEKGQGVPQDYREAIKWYGKAAAQGFSLAQFNLGHMYRKGRGVLRNDRVAVKWYREAATRGLASAQNSLGVMYEKGQGVPRDELRAYMWYHLAAARGNRPAKKRAAKLERRLSRETIAKGKRLAAEWEQGKDWEFASPGSVFIYVREVKIKFVLPDGYCPLNNKYRRDRELHGGYRRYAKELLVPLVFVRCEQLIRWRNDRRLTLNDLGHVMAERRQNPKFARMTRKQVLRFERKLQRGAYDPDRMRKLRDRMNELLKEEVRGARFTAQKFYGPAKHDEFAIYATGVQRLRTGAGEWKTVGIVHATTFVKGRILYINLNSRLTKRSDFDSLWAKQERLVRRLVAAN